MRVLAIRGENLASLEGPFAIELDADPIASAGVFAIVGPTGAGKSTLLDAMCLALFDTAPRVAGKSRVRIGREGDDDVERITMGDPRTLLRKGAGFAMAEVDFEGVDGRRYRARWEVRRSRSRADGKLQQVAMSLVDLDSEALVGGRKTDVKQAIEDKLGLTFDQFRRSVLLAQGDFAAFLDADPRDRADLLERMTGTEIYGRVSMEAHARLVEERQRFEILNEQLRQIPALDDLERARYEGELPALRLRVAEDELAQRNASEALRWHVELEALRRDEREAIEQKSAIDRQLALWETRRRELSAAEVALPLVPWLDGVTRARGLAVDRERTMQDLDRGAREAVAQAARAQAGAREAAEELAAAQSQWERALPGLERARSLDREVARLRSEIALLDEQAGAVRARHEDAFARTTILEAELDRHRALARDAEAWLAANKLAKKLAADWGRFADRAARALEAARACEASREAAARASDAQSGLEPELSAAWQALAIASRDAEAAERARGLAHDAAEAAPLVALAEVRARWTSRLASLESLAGVADLAEQAFSARRAKLERAAEAEREAGACEARRAALAIEIASCDVRLDEASRARDRVRATIDLAAHRADLVPGEPCPVCGATEHPFASHAPVADALLVEHEERLRDLRAERAEELEALARAGSDAQSSLRAAEEARLEAAAWSDKLEAARARWRELARGLGAEAEPWPEELPSAPVADVGAGGMDWGPLFAVAAAASDEGALLSAAARLGLEDARREAARKITELGQEEQRRRSLDRDRQEKMRAFEAARAAFERAREREAIAAGGFRDACERVARLVEQAEREERAWSRALDELAPALEGWPEWRAAAEARPEEFDSQVKQQAEAYLARHATLARALEAVRDREPELAALRTDAQSTRARLAELAAARDALASTLARAEQGRAALFLGRATSEVEAELSARVERAREASRESASLASASQSEAVRAEAAVAQARGALFDAIDAREASEAALARELEARGLDEEQSRLRIGRDPAELAVWRRELAELDASRLRQQTVCEERARRRLAHETGAPAGADRVTREQAQDALSTASARVKSTRELYDSTRTRLDQDDRAREQATALGQRVAAQYDRLQVWETLGDLIGSATGTKLRVFAQSLTLELLLEHANHHLRDLAPRYRLQRVPGEDLALQIVDFDLGQEVRSVGSLSGGESFLVALGLALGLASLSSRTTTVGSLFIDEGFGALDPSSLELVLATLDALQATGRQVGLISHVPAIAERFDVRVHVVPSGPGRSRVELVPAPAETKRPLSEPRLAPHAGATLDPTLGAAVGPASQGQLSLITAAQEE